MEVLTPVVKNQEYLIDIKGLGFQGEGVGRIENFTIFVEGALKGETVKVKIVKVNKNFAFGKLIDIVVKSEERVEPKCEIYKRCGGCQLQHLSYKAQLQFKKERVIDCLERIAKLNEVIVKDTLGMEDSELRYRNKVQLPIGESHGDGVIGFYAQRSHEIIDMKTCIIQDQVADQALELLRQWINEFNISIYNEETGRGILRHLMVRTGFKTGEVMLVIVTNEEYVPHIKEYVELMQNNIKGLKSMVQNINNKNTNVVLGDKCITLWGTDTISDYIENLKFKISPLSFFQINPVQTEVLYNKVLEFAGLTGDEIVFDAYCGTGTISLFLSEKAKKVYGVEIVPQAIDNAMENTENNNIKNVEFIVGESEKVIPELIAQNIMADVVVVDPPRKGCEKLLLEEIAKMGPKTIVYVSCDPSTLARDLGILKEMGYLVEEVQPVDMFPHTAHVETVVRLQRKQA
ncbi:MAG: 23S rRNA (uracil(1939)-C(5))-methyltransferase RlmD [Clostridiaceae bacterium]|nr:23S rRNA (uracil(1939)-C(5))-methyltransferase RlmD [Clostridiaceae bacterium]